MYIGRQWNWANALYIPIRNSSSFQQVIFDMSKVINIYVQWVYFSVFIDYTQPLWFNILSKSVNCCYTYTKCVRKTEEWQTIAISHNVINVEEGVCSLEMTAGLINGGLKNGGRYTLLRPPELGLCIVGSCIVNLTVLLSNGVTLGIIVLQFRNHSAWFLKSAFAYDKGKKQLQH